MKLLLLSVVFGLFLMNGVSFAQSPSEEIDRVKELKLLETTKEDVGKIFSKYGSSEESNYKHFVFTENANIKITYSSGKCSKKSEEWNVPEWIVTKVSLTFRDKPSIYEIGIDHSNFSRQILYSNVDESYVFYDKEIGLAVESIFGKVQTIHFFPPKYKTSMACEKDVVQKFYSNPTWIEGTQVKPRYTGRNYFPDVIGLSLSASEIIANCAFGSSNGGAESTSKIAIMASAIDPENDVMVYRYEVSGGIIIGRGADVVWDLSGEKPGDYTITASVDDGCGFCGKSITRSSKVIECREFQPK